MYNSSVNFYFEWNLNFSFLINTCDFSETVIKDNLFSVNADDACTYSLDHTYKCMTLMINYEIIIKLTIVSLLCLTMALCSIGGWGHRLSLIKLMYNSLPLLFVIRFTASDYSFGIFWSLCCLSFDWRLLIVPLVSSSFSCKGTFCSTTIVRKKHGKNDVTSCDVTFGHVTDVTSGHATSGYVTSGHVNNVTSGHVTSGDVIIGKSRLL